MCAMMQKLRIFFIDAFRVDYLIHRPAFFLGLVRAKIQKGAKEAAIEAGLNPRSLSSLFMPYPLRRNIL